MKKSRAVTQRAEAAEGEVIALRQRIAALEDTMIWLLGLHPDAPFPAVPDDWPARKFYWRSDLRKRLDDIDPSILASGGDDRTA